jgi:hypothetical protein
VILVAYESVSASERLVAQELAWWSVSDQRHRKGSESTIAALKFLAVGCSANAIQALTHTAAAMTVMI